MVGPLKITHIYFGRQWKEVNVGLAVALMNALFSRGIELFDPT